MSPVLTCMDEHAMPLYAIFHPCQFIVNGQATYIHGVSSWSVIDRNVFAGVRDLDCGNHDSYIPYGYSSHL
ncbi:MAG: hypothetical protein HXS54_02655 [Theionarchaea archaeon]|nr:hypothetical protein [Theionarchaea archaeon]